MASSTHLKSSGSSGSVGRRFPERGIPKRCRCGQGAVLRTARTAQNPGILFHCCPSRTDGDNNHLFKWCDESMVEDIEDLKEVVIDLKECIGNFDTEFSNIKGIVVGYEKELLKIGEMVHEVENEFNKSMGEVQNLKHIVVGFGVLVALGFYYWVM